VIGNGQRGALLFLVRRLSAALPVLLGVAIFTFVLMRVLPGDPAIFFASGPAAGEEEIRELRAKMGLDRSIPEQLWIYFKDLASGNLGMSLTTGRPVVADIAERLPASLELALFALVIALAIALPLGVAAALSPGSILDHAVRMICTAGVSLPTFVTGLILIYVFYYLLGVAPDPTGRLNIFLIAPPSRTGFLLVDTLIAGDFATFMAALHQLALPSATMSIYVLAPIARMTRASMLAVLSSDFVRTAVAMGLGRGTVIVVYAFKNAVIPVLTTVGVVFSSMLGANVLVEKVFSWPGVGSYALDALLGSDYAPVQGFVLLMAIIFVAVNFLIDTLYSLADPRVTVE